MVSLLTWPSGGFSWFLCLPHLLKGFRGFPAYLTFMRAFMIFLCLPHILEGFEGFSVPNLLEGFVVSLLTSHPWGLSWFFSGGFSRFLCLPHLLEVFRGSLLTSHPVGLSWFFSAYLTFWRVFKVSLLTGGFSLFFCLPHIVEGFHDVSAYFTPHILERSFQGSLLYLTS